LSLSNVKDYDVVFIYRESSGPAFVERILSPGLSADRVRFRRRDLPRKHQRCEHLIEAPVPSDDDRRRSTHVIAGNDYLADYARRFNLP
jgi:hypothetical protein